METILVTGSTGLLGSTLVPYLKKSGYNVITHARAMGADILVDLIDIEKTFDMLARIRPDVIINLASLTNVDLCQEHSNQAYLANVRPVENLSNWIRETGTGCHFIQISTDHLYDGDGLQSEENIKLTNCYAFSKYAGELAASRIPCTILRTNFFGRSKISHRVSMTDWVYNSLTSGNNIQVFDDVIFSPLSMLTLSEMIYLVMQKRPIGIFNLGSRNGMSKAEFSYYFSACLELPIETMTPIKSCTASFLKTYRPRNMRMDCAKFEATMQIQLPLLSDEINLAAKEYREQT
jgi:dTDP-4-dehydrorhamnose reductase